MRASIATMWAFSNESSTPPRSICWRSLPTSLRSIRWPFSNVHDASEGIGPTSGVDGFIEQLRRPNTKRLRDLPDRKKCRVLGAAFDCADVGAVDAHAIGDSFLTKRGSDSEPANVRAKEFADIHPQLKGRSRVIALRTTIRGTLRPHMMIDHGCGAALSSADPVVLSRGERGARLGIGQHVPLQAVFGVSAGSQADANGTR